ncbi:iron uptake system protein EfeO [Naasia aerilata]|uniref:Lipoprotein n=1 Tax=Naasia aerilata TaxID=1162966 RepID=A0ABM8G8U2_9MICO|nr:iron uptake system protein EfeO [Naasia aerilata]BDZ44601.1 lipoprotein [Naasia aerilata]
MPRRVLSAALAALALSAALAGCVRNDAAAAGIDVAISDDTCAVSASTSPAGAVEFRLENTGTDVSEFEILAEDKLRIAGEKENVTPGQTVSYVAQLEPGTYFTGCKFQMVGAPIGLTEFTVTGEASTSGDQAAAGEAVTGYLAYVRSQVGELVPAVAALADAYATGDDETARSLFAAARVPYERIEPTAEAFGDLDPKIDYREVDAVAEGLDWTGFHRIEKDLWPPAAGDLNSDGADALAGWSPSTPEQRRQFADRLVADVAQLQELVTEDSFSVTLADISNGAIALLDEVAVGKISGEEDWWSHTDLSDFAANVDGASVAFELVRPLAADSDDGTELTTEISGRFDDLRALLAEHGSLEEGFTSYAEVDDASRKTLSDAVNALAEPLSRLTATVLAAQ